MPYLHAQAGGRGGNPKSRIMDMLQLQDETDFNSLKPDAWGIPSIPSDSVNHRRNGLGGLGISNKAAAADGQHGYPKLQLIFMPAVAFDQSRQRLGHGKGFYDRYLHTYKMTLESTAGTDVECRMPYLGM